MGVFDGNNLLAVRNDDGEKDDDDDGDDGDDGDDVCCYRIDDAW